MRRYLTVVGFLLVSIAQAAEPYVPAELEPWRDWVLHGQEHRQCPFFAAGGYGEPDQHVCAWAGPLELDTTRTGAVFIQTWRLYRDGWLPLPGDAQIWPDEVRAGSRTVAAVLRQGRPHVFLPAGEHRLAGAFLWTRRPAALLVPEQTGLVELTVDGNNVAFPSIDRGRLMLGGQRAATTSAESLRITVHRRLSDGIPMTLNTQVRLEVSGPGREMLLGQLLPAGFVPLTLDSPLPARIETNGRLRMQLRPGEWQLFVTARSEQMPEAVVSPVQPGPWAEAEIWSWQANDQLRVTSIEGGDPVDPTRVAVPPQWRNLPATRLEPGQTLNITERTRGLSDNLQNRLVLHRRMWRDFNGGGYTTVDTLAGSMETGWRLDMAAPYRLESASLSGDNLLVTRGPNPELTGVEVRNAQLALSAIGRVPTAASVLPATGWVEDFTQAHTTLFLPPAHRLIAAFGVDQTSGDWVGQWRLLDYFLVLLIAVALGRLFGRWLGVLVLALLALAYHEPGTPIWVWLAVAALVALARYAPEGRLRRLSIWGRNGAFAALVLLALPFAASQLRLSLFPQLEPVGFSMAPVTAAYEQEADFVQASPPVAALEDAMDSASMRGTAESKVVVTGSRTQRVDIEGPPPQRYAPGTLVQTGPGVPEWERNRVTLQWSGPVAAGQTMRLMVLPPWALRGLRLLVVVLLAVVLWRISRQLFELPRWPRGRAASGVLAALIAVTCVAVPDLAQAQSTPDPRLLSELRERLLEPPDCAPRCAEIRSANIDVSGDRLTMELNVDALDGVAVPLPGSSGGWRPRTVAVDGNPVRVFYRDGADVVWLALATGQHTVSLSGPLPPTDSVQVPFAERPHRVRVTATDWEVSGVTDDRLVSGALELLRIRAADAAGPSLEPERFPVFVEVIRELLFNVDWQVHTVMTRIAPAQGGFTVTIPLVPGEQPLDESLEVRDGAVKVAFAAGVRERRWTSSLELASPLTLSAPQSLEYAEVWRLVPGPAWRLSHHGVPLISATSGGSTFGPQFQPLPGESLQLHLERPEALEGQTLTFDNVAMTQTQGRRGSDTALTLAYRSTRGGNHAIDIPADAQVIDVTTDGSRQSVRPVDGELRLPVLPGAHRVVVQWRADQPMTARSLTPRVNLNAAAGNVTQMLNLPADRWVLLASGPSLGPAVLYWSELAAFILIALALGRTTMTPLRTHHWLLLGLGFSTFSWGVLLLLGGWLFALARRRRATMPQTRWLYNLLQTLLVVLTVTTLVALLVAIPQALLGYPDMHVVGNQSHSGHLRWFTDRIAGELPAASALSVPLWVYKGAILLWALWLAFALLKWLPWAWRSWSEGGIWRGKILAPPADDAAAE